MCSTAARTDLLHANTADQSRNDEKSIGAHKRSRTTAELNSAHRLAMLGGSDEQAIAPPRRRSTNLVD